MFIFVALLVVAACGSSVEKADPQGRSGPGSADGGAASQPAVGGEEAYQESLRAQFCLQCFRSPSPLTLEGLDLCLGEDLDCFFETRTTQYVEALLACDCDSSCVDEVVQDFEPSPTFAGFTQACDEVCNGPNSACDGFAGWPGVLTDESYETWTACLEQSTCADAKTCYYQMEFCASL